LGFSSVTEQEVQSARHVLRIGCRHGHNRHSSFLPLEFVDRPHPGSLSQPALERPDLCVVRGEDEDVIGFDGVLLAALVDPLLAKEAFVEDRDALDFRGFQGNVAVNLSLKTAQVVNAGNLTLRLAGAMNSAAEPTTALGIEDVYGSNASNTLTGNSRDNIFYFGNKLAGAVDTVSGSTGEDRLDFSARSSGITIDLQRVGTNQTIATG